MYENVVDALNARRFQCVMVETEAEAVSEALRIIGGRSVGFGGSRTVDELRLFDRLREQGNRVYWHWKVPKEEKPQTRLDARDADVFLCSVNAILEDGRLVNIDGTGNRVSGMVFGPSTVLVIAGVNKIAADYDSAIARIKRYACGPNARRLGLHTPCATLDECRDCRGADRMCNATMILEYPTRVGHDFHIILVNTSLGL